MQFNRIHMPIVLCLLNNTSFTVTRCIFDTFADCVGLGRILRLSLYLLSR